jgi:hypothetical protein
MRAVPSGIAGTPDTGIRVRLPMPPNERRARRLKPPLRQKADKNVRPSIYEVSAIALYMHRPGTCLT